MLAFAHVMRVHWSHTHALTGRTSPAPCPPPRQDANGNGTRSRWGAIKETGSRGSEVYQHVIEHFAIELRGGRSNLAQDLAQHPQQGARACATRPRSDQHPSATFSTHTRPRKQVPSGKEHALVAPHTHIHTPHASHNKHHTTRIGKKGRGGEGRERQGNWLGGGGGGRQRVA